MGDGCFKMFDLFVIVVVCKNDEEEEDEARI